MKTTIVKLDARRPDPDLIRQVAGQLARGKIVAFPTETVYGLAVVANNPAALVRLNELKQRPTDKLFTFHIGSIAALEKMDIIQSRALRYFIHEFWPGPVTLVALNRKDEKTGLRFPKNEIAIQMINQTGEPVVGTSANISGDKSPTTAEEVLRIFPNELDIIIDGGPSELGQDSTVVDVAVNPPQILRPGAWADRVQAAIEKVKRGQYPRKYILVVCTGNTCRSPMAEAWLKAELARKGLEEQIAVSSAGMRAWDGQLASAETILVLKNDEIFLEGFRTHRCRREDILSSDLIIAMTDEHAEAVLDAVPEAASKILTLNIEDPIGGSFDIYKDVYKSIQKKIQASWQAIVT